MPEPPRKEDPLEWWSRHDRNMRAQKRLWDNQQRRIREENEKIAENHRRAREARRKKKEKEAARRAERARKKQEKRERKRREKGLDVDLNNLSTVPQAGTVSDPVKPGQDQDPAHRAGRERKKQEKRERKSRQKRQDVDLNDLSPAPETGAVREPVMTTPVAGLGPIDLFIPAFALALAGLVIYLLYSFNPGMAWYVYAIAGSAAAASAYLVLKQVEAYARILFYASIAAAVTVIGALIVS